MKAQAYQQAKDIDSERDRDEGTKRQGGEIHIPS